MEIKELYQTEPHEPYYKDKQTGELKCTFSHSEFKDKSGVYVITKNGVPVYIGYSANDLYTTMYRHFQSWNDPTQKRVTFSKTGHRTKVQIILCPPKQAAELEAELIVKFKPRFNDQKLNWYTRETPIKVTKPKSKMSERELADAEFQEEIERRNAIPDPF